jgi:hypothetical protein
MKQLLSLSSSRPVYTTKTMPHGESKFGTSAANDSQREAASGYAKWGHTPPSLPVDSLSSAQQEASERWTEATRLSFQLFERDLPDMPTSLLTTIRLGAQLWHARSEPRGKPLHVFNGPKLLAVLNTRSLKVAVRNDIKIADLFVLNVQTFPEAAAATPAGFTQQSLWDMIWQFALHDPDALAELPGDIAWRPLQLRRLPYVSSDLLAPSHAHILKLLLKDNLSFEQLLLLTQLPPHRLCHSIAALVLTRAIKPI